MVGVDPDDRSTFRSTGVFDRFGLWTFNEIST